jgi:hypothetical protein
MTWFYGWVVLLSPVVLIVVQVFHLYDVEYGLCLCESCGLPSFEM